VEERDLTRETRWRLAALEALGALVTLERPGPGGEWECRVLLFSAWTEAGRGATAEEAARAALNAAERRLVG
jgi:hypothetical protein